MTRFRLPRRLGVAVAALALAAWPAMPAIGLDLSLSLQPRPPASDNGSRLGCPAPSAADVGGTRGAGRAPSAEQAAHHSGSPQGQRSAAERRATRPRGSRAAHDQAGP